jgi:hypothetical protein
MPTFDFKAPQKGFLVAVRKEGTFTIVSPKPLTREEALSFGAFKVGTTASATFKLIGTDKPAETSFTKKYLGLLDTQFYKKGETFIEKKQYRISTAGELKEITYKGLDVLRSRSSFKNLIGKIK